VGKKVDSSISERVRCATVEWLPIKQPFLRVGQSLAEGNSDNNTFWEPHDLSSIRSGRCYGRVGYESPGTNGCELENQQLQLSTIAMAKFMIGRL
jgi:hypothetical protein